MFYEGGVIHEGEHLTYKVVRTHNWDGTKRYRTIVGITKANKLKDKWEEEFGEHWSVAVNYHRTVR